MSSDQPLVSIIITSYNYGYYIGQTIRSVLAQTYKNWELIISDDGSSDNSLEVIHSFTDPRITLIASETNEGAPAAYFKAYTHCTGKYFSSLDSDDYIAPDKLEKQVQYLEKHPEVDILGTFIIEVDATGQIISDEGQYQAWFSQELDLNQPNNWLWQNHLCHSSALIRKVFHDRVGLINPNLPYTGDYEFWVRCLINGGRFHILEERLTYYRAHNGNVTHKNPDRTLLEIAYIHTLLKPYFLKLNRADLLDKAIHLVHQQCLHREIDKNLKANIMSQLLFADDEPDNFEQFLGKLSHPAGIEALMIAGIFDHFSEEVQALKTHTTYLEQFLANKETHISNLEAHINHLETHIANLEAHTAKLKQLLASKETRIGDLEQRLATIERTKAWQLLRKWYGFKHFLAGSK